MAESPILSAQNLVKKYFTFEKLFSNSKHEFCAVDHVSLDIHKGENIGIVGQSGCGKTTLARMLVGMLTPDSGKVLYKGRDSHGDKEYRKNIQMVFQNPEMSLNPRLKIKSMLNDLLIPRFKDKKTARIEAERLMEMTGLSPEHLDRYPSELSGGQKQRISLSRAMAVEPEIIIADEPVSSLDVSVQAQILNLMDDLRKDHGITFVLISHDIAVVSWLCEKIAVMHEGKIIEYGNTEKVLKNPREEYTSDLIRSAYL